MRGRANSNWQEQTAQMRPDSMILELKRAKFTGIYVDKAGLADSTLIPALEKELGKAKLVSEDSKLCIYTFK